MFNKKYYNISLPFMTKENIRRTENFKNYLINNNFKIIISLFETGFLHFKIFINSKKEFDEINKMLNITVFYDSIIQENHF
jgi:hypothetical protein